MDVSVLDENTIQIEPACSMLFYSLDTTAVGRILAASGTPGAFTQPVVNDNYKNNGGVVTHKLLRMSLPSLPRTMPGCLPCSRRLPRRNCPWRN